MKMRLLNVRFDGPTVALLDQVLAGALEHCPGSPVDACIHHPRVVS